MGSSSATTGSSWASPTAGGEGSSSSGGEPDGPRPPELLPLGEYCGDGERRTASFCFVRVEVGDRPGRPFARVGVAVDLDGDGHSSFGIGDRREADAGVGFEYFLTMAHLQTDGSFRLDAEVETQQFWADFAGDFDGDGDDDVMGAIETAGSGSEIFVHRSQGNMIADLERHEVVEPGGTWPAFVMDIDGDGWVEAVVGREGEGAQVFRRELDLWVETSSLLPLPSCMNLSESAFADFDGDGTVDVVTTGGTQSCDPHPQSYDPAWHRVAVFLAEPEGPTLIAGPQVPMGGVNLTPSDANLGLHAGDFDGDGIADILVPLVDTASSTPSGTSLLRGHGDGTFDEPVVVSRADLGGFTIIRPGDFDGDGRLDLLASREDARTGLVELAIVHGDWPRPQWVTIAILDGTGILAVGDVNGDGAADMLTTDPSLTPPNGGFTHYIALVSAP